MNGDAVYIGDIGKVVGFFEQGIDGILNDIAAAIMGAAVELFSGLGNVPALGSEEINNQIQLQTNWLVVTIAVAACLAAAFRMALERRGQPLTTVLMGLVRLVLTVGLSWTVLQWLVAEADRYSSHLYDQGVKQQLKLIANCGTDGLTAFLLIVIGLLLLLAGCVHVVLMYIRLGVMVLLTGTLPVAAAASMTEWGQGWWRKHIAWMTAWLAFKPVVGLIMYSGAAMIQAVSDISNEDKAGTVRHFKLAGAGILLLATVALPALMRLIVPAMEALGSRDGVGAGIAAGAAAANVVASGARRVVGGGQGSSAGTARLRAPSGGGVPARGGSTGGPGSRAVPGAPGGGAAGGPGGGATGGPGGGSGDGASGGSGGSRSTTERIVRTTGHIAASTARTSARAVQLGARAATSGHRYASGIATGAVPDDR